MYSSRQSKVHFKPTSLRIFMISSIWTINRNHLYIFTLLFSYFHENEFSHFLSMNLLWLFCRLKRYLLVLDVRLLTSVLVPEVRFGKRKTILAFLASQNGKISIGEIRIDMFQKIFFEYDCI